MKAYPRKSGPLGSSRKHQIINKEEVMRLLQRPRSKLVEMWKRDALFEWYRKQNARAPMYNPSSSIQEDVKNVIFPGEKCVRCKTAATKRRKKTNLVRVLWFNAVLSFLGIMLFI